MPTPKILKVEEARQILRIGRNRFYELLKSGQLKAIRNGRNYLIPESCLHAFIETELTGKVGDQHD